MRSCRQSRTSCSDVGVEMVGRPVLDHVRAARRDQWIEHLERCLRLVQQMRRIVDDEVDGRPVEFLLSDCRDPYSVRVIDAVLRTYSPAESAFFDELCERCVLSTS